MRAEERQLEKETMSVRAFLRDFTALLLGLTLVSLAASQDLQRGLRNYQDIIGGRKKLEQLSPQEQGEVIQVHRLLKARSGKEGASSACRSARSEAANAASELADYSRRLRNCAEAEDFTDDCESEFRRVKNAHSDYESAVSNVSGSCQ
jgi:hypothetical protein